MTEGMCHSSRNRNEGKKRRTSYRGDFRSDGVSDKKSAVALTRVYVLDLTESSVIFSACRLMSNCRNGRACGEIDSFPGFRHSATTTAGHQFGCQVISEELRY